MNPKKLISKKEERFTFGKSSAADNPASHPTTSTITSHPTVSFTCFKAQ